VKKLRPFYTPDVVKQIYATQYDSQYWPEHRERVAQTIGIAQRLIMEHQLQSVADYSCGDGTIAKSLVGVTMDLRDVSLGNEPIEVEVTRMEPVDLFLCTETIEHLEAPWTVLEHIARSARFLVLSTPLDESVYIGNHEHYWSFTDMDIESLLAQSDFKSLSYVPLTQPGWTYTYQIWTARSLRFA